jgi:G-patch domain
MAREFGLKSKSHGREADRYTILSKKETETAWDDRAFDRSARKSALVHVLKSKNGNDSRSNQADAWETSVGWSEPAPLPKRAGELKAKKWMEKMGWSEGEGLGSTNKGIIDPIKAEKRYANTGLGFGA